MPPGAPLSEAPQLGKGDEIDLSAQRLFRLA